MMTSSLRESFAELGEALAVERALFDQMRFKLVVMHLVREDGRPSILEEAQRQLERAVNEVRSSAAPHLRMIEELVGTDTADATAPLAALVDMAEEPYRTMLADHVAWFTCVAAEIEAGRILDAEAATGTDLLERELEEVLYRAARGALSGGLGISLARYLRAGIHDVRTPDA